MQLRCGGLAAEAAHDAEEETTLKLITFPVPCSRQAEIFLQSWHGPRMRHACWVGAHLASVELSQPAAPPATLSRAYVGLTVVITLLYTMPPYRHI